ncbi:MAG: hypothetical protein O2856_13270 [Planctomycetota bacterium]|nr:hypothetical protein [Planctomycetota bacterium]
MYLKLHPLALIERKLPGRSTNLGTALSGYDAFSIGVSHLQLRLAANPLPGDQDPAVGDRILVNNFTPDSVMLIRGQDGYVFPTAFLSMPTLHLTAIQDQDVIAAFFLKTTAAIGASPDNELLKILVLGDKTDNSQAGPSKIRFTTTGALLNTEFREIDSKMSGLTALLDDGFAGDPRIIRAIAAIDATQWANKSVVWILHRKAPSTGLMMHIILPVKSLGRFSSDGSDFRSLLDPSERDPKEKWETIFGSKIPTDLRIEDGDRLELTLLELTGPFSQISVK